MRGKFYLIFLVLCRLIIEHGSAQAANLAFNLGDLLPLLFSHRFRRELRFLQVAPSILQLALGAVDLRADVFLGLHRLDRRSLLSCHAPRRHKVGNIAVPLLSADISTVTSLCDAPGIKSIAKPDAWNFFLSKSHEPLVFIGLCIH